jgi:hypothetical protein
MHKGRLLFFACILCWTSAPVVAWAGELFWYDADLANGRIRHCNLASCSPADFETGVAAGLDNDIAIDPLEGMIYWQVNGSVAGTKKIQRRSLSGGAVQDIFDVSTTVTGMAIDPLARHVYMGTPGAATRIHRFSIDDPENPTIFVHAFDVGCSSCQPQGLALDLAGGFLYWADPVHGKIARKALALPGPITDVVTGVSQPSALALDLANDRVYFSQTVPARVTYALLSSPTTLADLLNPAPASLFAGSLERDPTDGALGEMYVALGGTGEIRHCSIDAGCPSLTLLDDGLIGPRGLALLLSPHVPALGRLGAAATCLALLLAVVALRQRTWPRRAG